MIVSELMLLGIDIKKEEKGRGITAVNHDTNNNRNNQSWFRPREVW
jgi:hypothetical protein